MLLLASTYSNRVFGGSEFHQVERTGRIDFAVVNHWWAIRSERFRHQLQILLRYLTAIPFRASRLN